jgi:hypothetical protein
MDPTRVSPLPEWPQAAKHELDGHDDVLSHTRAESASSAVRSVWRRRHLSSHLRPSRRLLGPTGQNTVTATDRPLQLDIYVKRGRTGR